MRKKLFLVTLLALVAIVSCKKDSLQNTVVIPSTNNIKVPVGFTWESSRNLNITINVTDNRFQSMIHVISIYDATPSAGGNLLAKGSATTSTAFKSKLYLSKQITVIYILKTAVDNSTSIQKIQVGNADIVLSIDK